jgi:hypothetical protein
MSTTLRTVLRPTVPYIVVSQNDYGLTVVNGWWTPARYPNVLILSAGGYGHVPLPLFLRDQELYRRELQQRQLLVSYVGSDRHAPGKMRTKMIEIVEAISKLYNLTTYVGHVPSWRDVMANSRASLCPRGYGRTSFHLLETLQMGLIPVHVFIDREWLPYSKLFHTFGFSCDLRGLPGVIERIRMMRVDELEAREAIVRGLRLSHFSHSGTMKHVSGFMQRTESDLVCEALPDSVRAAAYVSNKDLKTRLE